MTQFLRHLPHACPQTTMTVLPRFFRDVGAEPTTSIFARRSSLRCFTRCYWDMLCTLTGSAGNMQWLLDMIFLPCRMLHGKACKTVRSENEITECHASGR